MAELPEYLQDQTFESILQRMLNALPADLDKSEGSPIYDAIAPVAAELAQAAIWAQEVLRRGFAQTTFGAYLDLKAEECGVVRRPAVVATGMVEFTGTPGTIIPAGTMVSTVGSDVASAVFFSTIDDATIGAEGRVVVGVKAVEAGKSGNVAAGTIVMLTQSISGVATVTNLEPTTGGFDEESDESLLERYLEAAREERGGGNVADYRVWAGEVPGVGYRLVDPLWQGPNTVRVVILDQYGNIPSPELVAAVQEYLDPGGQGLGLGKAPPGAKVTVQAPREVALTIIVPNLTVEPGYTLLQARSNLEARARDYFLSISPGGVVRIKDLESAINAAAGVLDFGDVLVSGSRQNIMLAVDEKAVLTEVIYT